MQDILTVEWMLGIITLGTAAVLARVWKIPAIEQKLDNVIKETDTNRRSIHDIRNHIQHHETRITLLEKSKQENPKS